ncbi:energy transducer TonB [Sphingomonas sp. JC676]|uniref:energy transducer TonB n=1 Tax=Sphingomonas sp. JC676 TaxID=2768065 RepID=UPI001657F5DE|nr:energy transducer TonB [Sphingomonas sp. JC676]MBC9031961.1 energy transducer TonB [Sphingomonas sp. JC676]
MPAPAPIVTAPLPEQGSNILSGKAPVTAPGSDTRGQGSGTAAAGNGSGEGGDTPLRLIEGAIRDADYPRAAARVGASGTVYLRFIVDVRGRVTDCTVTRSSGHAALDNATCRLIRKRFAISRARTRRGAPMPTS